jgi:hypothetical protein
VVFGVYLELLSRTLILGCLFEFLGCVFKIFFHFFSAGFSSKLVL